MQRRLVIGGLGGLALIISIVCSHGAAADTYAASYSYSQTSKREAAAPDPAVASALRAEVEGTSVRDVRIEELLRRGQQLEHSERWGEALAHYESALREFPEQDKLRRRFDVARMHYDLRRRYADDSFCHAVDGLTFQRALDLYTEVLLQVQKHYVKTPHWKALFEQGLNGLDVALDEEVFRSRHIPHAQRESVDELRRALRRELGSLMIENHMQSQRAVALAAQMAQRQLGLSPTGTVLEFMCGATNSLDVYSAYLTPDQLAEVYSQIEGNFVGLGIELRMDNSVLEIVRVISGSPAQAAGIRDGDRIIAVDGRSVADMSTDEAADLLQGPAGSLCTLDILSSGRAARRLQVRRQRVEVPSVDNVHIIDRAKGIGYLRLSCFQKTTCKDLDNALWQLYHQGMRGGLIVDLRGNPGGVLITSVEAVDRFIDRGVIVSTRGRDARESLTYSAHVQGTWRVPLVVLIDEDSASAAEIFAGAIRDHQRGTIVGRQSYGKGSVQGIFPLNGSRAGMRLTTAKFYSPNGRPYSLVGVKPDVLVQTAAKPPVAPEAIDTAGTVMENASGVAAAPTITMNVARDDLRDPAIAAAVDVARRMGSRQ